MDSEPKEIRPVDLRGILKYVPQWRDHVFVVAIDGAIVRHENFPNILLDLAVLHNLHIRLVLVYGIGDPLVEMARKSGISITDARGEGPTDEATLDLAVGAAGIVGHRLMQGLTQNGLRGAMTNAVRATEVGVIHGVDQQKLGKVERIDAKMLNRLIESGIVPLISPVAFTREGACLRISSDLLAAELSLALGASKIIYLCPSPGIVIDGRFVTNVPETELSRVLESRPESIAPEVSGKIRHAVRTVQGGTPRAHIIDGRVYEGLLTEIFSKVGIGSMIYRNEYEEIRPARKKDATAIYNITRGGVRDESLRRRTRSEIERDIEQFFVYEVDASLIGCISLRPMEKPGWVELETVYVQPFYQGKGVGKKLVEFSCLHARDHGFTHMLALTTQSYGFFRRKCGFGDGTSEDLSEERRKTFEQSGRNSKILVRHLTEPAAQ